MDHYTEFGRLHGTTGTPDCIACFPARFKNQCKSCGPSRCFQSNQLHQIINTTMVWDALEAVERHLCTDRSWLFTHINASLLTRVDQNHSTSLQIISRLPGISWWILPAKWIHAASLFSFVYIPTSGAFKLIAESAGLVLLSERWMGNSGYCLAGDSAEFSGEED